MIHVYAMLFLIGALGLLAQTLLGVAGSHGGHGHGGHAHGGHSHDHAGHGKTATPQSRGQSGSSRVGEMLLTVLSPLTLFSLCLGVGATGLMLRPLHLADLVRVPLSLLGGLLFYSLLIRPVWGLIFRFASTPAQALEGAVASVAEALTRFDAGGKGLVRLTVDGQIVRILAYLETDERGDAPLVRPGDNLTVVSVDGHTNSCRVTRL